MNLFCQLLSTPSIAAGLGTAVLMLHCSPHNCVRASKTLCYQLLSAASRAAGLGALHLRLCSQHICVRTSKNLFCLLISASSCAAGLGATVTPTSCAAFAHSAGCFAFAHGTGCMSLLLFFGQHAQYDVLAGLGAGVSTLHCSPYTCLRVSKALFWSAALHYSEH